MKMLASLEANDRLWVFGQLLVGFIYFMTQDDVPLPDGVDFAAADRDEGEENNNKRAVKILQHVIHIAKSVRYTKPYIYQLAKQYVQFIIKDDRFVALEDIEQASLMCDVKEFTDGQYGKREDEEEELDEELALALEICRREANERNNNALESEGYEDDNAVLAEILSSIGITPGEEETAAGAENNGYDSEQN